MDNFGEDLAKFMVWSIVIGVGAGLIIGALVVWLVGL